jgi:hypothetical protein
MLLDLVCKLARIMIQKVAWYKYRDTYFTVSVTGPLRYYMLKVTSGLNLRHCLRLKKIVGALNIHPVFKYSEDIIMTILQKTP